MATENVVEEDVSGVAIVMRDLNTALNREVDAAAVKLRGLTENLNAPSTAISLVNAMMQNVGARQIVIDAIQSVAENTLFHLFCVLDAVRDPDGAPQTCCRSGLPSTLKRSQTSARTEKCFTTPF